MILASLSPRDRRTLRLGGLVALPVAVFSLVLRPYVGALFDARDDLTRERDLLAREQGVLSGADRYSRVIADAGAALRGEGPRLFRGVDELAAASALEGYVADQASRHRVAVERSESRSAGRTSAGLVALEADFRATGDLQGILALLRALETGPRLVRVERIAIERRAAATPDVEVLSLSATAQGFSLVAPTQLGDTLAGREAEVAP